MGSSTAGRNFKGEHRARGLHPSRSWTVVDLLGFDGDPFDCRTFVDLTFLDDKPLYNKAKSPCFSPFKRNR